MCIRYNLIIDQHYFWQAKPQSHLDPKTYIINIHIYLKSDSAIKLTVWANIEVKYGHLWECKLLGKETNS